MAAPATRRAASEPLADLPERVVFFDGVCVFCDRTVQWILQRDPEARFHFAALQGETAARVALALPDRFPTDLDTVALLHRPHGTPVLELRSRAVFQVLDDLGGRTRRWTWLRVLPLWLTDLLYAGFIRMRYRLFGKLETCRVPTPDERARFLP